MSRRTLLFPPPVGAPASPSLRASYDLEPSFDLETGDIIEPNEGGRIALVERQVVNAQNRQRGMKLLRDLYVARSVVANLDGCMLTQVTNATAGPVRMARFDTFEAMLASLQGGLQGGATKVCVPTLAPAAADLVVTAAGNAFGYVITISTPKNTGRCGGGTLTVAITTGGAVVTSTLAITPNPYSTGPHDFHVARFVILSCTNNGGEGNPSVATTVTATLAQTDPFWIASTTVMSVETLNNRDLVKVI